jgi:hypothetical protein
MTIWNIPIEPLEERYSAQWAHWFPEEFIKRDIDYKAIPGTPLTEIIENGSFLDVCGTNYFKASQLMQISRLIHSNKIKDGDAFLFHDLWFPGLEMLAYMRDGLKINFKIAGILHAGTYDPNDFLTKQGMTWGEKLEESWFDIVDIIFVATDYHRRLLVNNRYIDYSKIKVTGLPIFDDFTPRPMPKKEELIVFPHRLDDEKNPHLFTKLAYSLDGGDRGWRFLKTMNAWTDKKKYYSQLAKAKVAVSFADQETWGIAMQEALFLGCVPIVPDRLSYVEMYHPMFRYSSYDEAVNMVAYGMEKYNSEEVRDAIKTNRTILLKKGREAIGNMLCEIIKVK